MSLLRADAWVGPGGIYKCHNRETKFVGHFHQAQGFAIAFRVGRTKIALNVLFRVAALLGSDNHHALFADFGEPTYHRFVLRKEAIAVQLMKIGKRGAKVIEGERATRVPGKLDALPGGEIAVDLPASFFE